ncbi:MAG TPA: OmpH family outer membrane protein [Parvularculaceae bacterium]|nr:OmpH family outer membrane protein [Parvularculaceae bacterium]HRX40581.1 OmpH family outer membrane protein [Parvularculaceae bacterium]
MKRKLIGLAGAAFLAVTGLAAGASVVSAQAQQAGKAPVILILDQAQVIAQSKAGVSMSTQLKALQDSANTELNAEVEKINKETEDLKKQKDLMAEDVWMEKAKQLSVKQNNLPALREVKVRELSISEQQALGKINDAMMPILKKIVEDRGATVMLDRSAVMYASVDTNITAEVIAELDKVLSTVKVEKVSLADLQRQALEAQKKNDDKKKK